MLVTFKSHLFTAQEQAIPVSEVKQAGQKAGWHERGSSGTQVEKESLWTLGARTGDTGGL